MEYVTQNGDKRDVTEKQHSAFDRKPGHDGDESQPTIETRHRSGVSRPLTLALETLVGAETSSPTVEPTSDESK